MDHKALLIALLGLEATATDEAISNSAQTFQSDMVEFRNSMQEENAALLNRAETAEQAAGQVETLNNTIKSLTEELVAQDLERYKDVISNTDEVKAALLSNRSGTITVLKNASAKISNTRTQAPARPAPVHDASRAVTPAPGNDPMNNARPTASEDVAKKISNRAREISAALKVSHQQAWTMAQGEVLKNASATVTTE